MITLLSDFGYQDAYVSIMKGVIAAIAPSETTCDLTHAISPQDILSARFNLKIAYPHFPSETVHLAVVDPGVGSARRAVAIRCQRDDWACFLVGPDNGIFSGIVEDFLEDSSSSITAVTLTNSRYWRSKMTAESLSSTFHGRDIFAPVAAHLANGVAIESLGDRIDPDSLVSANIRSFEVLVNNSWPHFINAVDTKSRKFNPRSDGESVKNDRKVLAVGCIQYVDRFGNLISNIPEQAVSDIAWHVWLDVPFDQALISGIKTYSDAKADDVAALVGSHGWVEIACNCGSASAYFEESGGVPVGTMAAIVTGQ